MDAKRKPYHSLSLMEFQVRFPNENTCWAYLSKLRWSEKRICPACSQERWSLVKTRKLFECLHCGKQVSATSGTIFHKSRVPLRKWFWAIYFVATSKKGISALHLQRQLDLGSYRTAWLMMHKIRQAMIEREELYTLSGTVQMDEFGVGGKKSREKLRKLGENASPFKNKIPFLMAVEEFDHGGPRFIRTEALNDITGDEIVPVIEKRVQKGSTLKSDGASVYRQAARLHGYGIEQSSYSQEPQATLKHLKWTNLLISNFKRYLLGTYHYTGKRYAKAYGAEFAYRFNRRNWPDQAFDRLLFACAQAGPKNMSELSA
jgi:ISXO2-like transposase domain/Transposase zinc-ribbon domain